MDDSLNIVPCFRYGANSIVLVGSPDLRLKSLIPKHLDPSIEFTDILYCLLEVVGQARKWGVSRNTLTKKYFKIDARSTFCFVKQLTAAGLIVVKVNIIYSFYYSIH